METSPHPPFSPDLAPSDVYLVDYVKGCFAGLLFENVDELLEAVHGVLEGIEKGLCRRPILSGGTD
jgi:hypothetical protein